MIPMITFECDDLSTYHLPPPYISSSFLVLPHRDFAVTRLLPALLPPVRSSRRTMIRPLSSYISVQIPSNGGSGFLQSCLAILLFLSFLALEYGL